VAGDNCPQQIRREEEVAMFCLASRYQTDAKNLGEIVRIFKEQALPLVSRQKGFKGVYIMTKPSGEFMVLNIWDTEEQANAWPQNPEHLKIVAQLKPMLTGAPVRDGYEVRAYTVSKG
jgi:heme-degrading monooxygenase HmoA